MTQEDKNFAGDEVIKVDSEAPLTTDQIMRMLLKTQADLAKSQTQLAEAIAASRVPYVDPKVLAQKQRDLEERRLQIQHDQKVKEATKRICGHKRENGTSNISWMEHSNGIILGVCGLCQSQFDARIPADAELLRGNLKALKNMGRAGQHARVGAIVG